MTHPTRTRPTEGYRIRVLMSFNAGDEAEAYLVYSNGGAHGILRGVYAVPSHRRLRRWYWKGATEAAALRKAKQYLRDQGVLSLSLFVKEIKL